MVTTWKWVKGDSARVYFEHSDGTRLGYLDLDTGLPGDVDLRRARDFYAALALWRDRHPTPPRTDAPELVQQLSPPAPPADPTTPRRPLDAYGPPPTDPPVGVTIREHPEPRRRRRPAPADPAQWTDLATNAPGQGAAAVAAQLRRDRPIATWLGRLLGLRTDERAWRIGARGEEKTARHLRKLVKPGSGWYVLHAVPVTARGTDIDHVIIGPAGIYTVNTKHHPRGFVSTNPTGITVNRHHTRYAETSRAEATRAGRLLGTALGVGPIAVTPVIAVVGAGVRGAHQPHGVTVLPAGKLPRWLRRQPAVLTPATVDRLYAIARRSTTWLPGR